METVVVTGAFGYLGRHVSLAASQAGARIIGIGHGGWSEAEASEWGVSIWHESDVTVEALALHVRSASAIIHCAGSGSAGLALESPKQDFGRTVATTLEVLEFVRSSSPATAVVYPSSGAVYGHPAAIPIREEAPLDPVSPYGVHKKIAEDLIRSYARSFNVRVAIARIFSIYGVGLRKQLFWDACHKAMRGDFLFSGTGTETRDWVAIDDVARLLLIIRDRAAPDAPVVNCATGIETPIKDILATLFGALGIDEDPHFSGVRRTADPERYAGHPARALMWGWEPKRAWQDGVIEYARWFLAKNT